MMYTRSSGSRGLFLRDNVRKGEKSGNITAMGKKNYKLAPDDENENERMGDWEIEDSRRIFAWP